MFSFSTIFSACGVTMSADEEAYFPNKAKEEAFLHTLSDGTSSQHYSYAIFAEHLTDAYYLQEGRLTLTVYEEAKDGSLNAVQHTSLFHTVPISTSKARGCTSSAVSVRVQTRLTWTAADSIKFTRRSKTLATWFMSTSCVKSFALFTIS